jgi:hypothetical protein
MLTYAPAGALLVAAALLNVKMQSEEEVPAAAE